ncbi:phosphodiesterase [Niabella ginsenosidivorans]|uniref:Phosphodiesterase n=1 Tax=Niabella ginsenosidivorans TaxID=1176587 RepID=A0A1A9I616_9BACT|nr:ectonucleotide pyrophosphatase/phosphodiesterase [Niabella ginsenosidivorans]ANH82150.1 phosphodiesterase [Niabella ginsenosidivorans]
MSQLRYGLFLVAFVAATSLNAQDTSQYIIPGRVNTIEQQQKPYVVLISIDGFRYDLADKHNAVFLKKMRDAGVAAASMKPCFPSLTFPNHYSIITGLYPSHHGLVDNSFYDARKNAYYKVGDKRAVEDSSWYGGEPLWVLAEKQKMITASFYWVGSESHINGMPPTYYYKYNEAISIDRRVEILKEWLQQPAETRPHLITFYFPQVDHQEHMHGVDAKETEEAVHLVDDAIRKMYEACRSTGLPVNFVVVSDHGFANLDTAKIVPVALITGLIDTSKFLMAGGGTMIHLYAKNKADIKPAYKRLREQTDFQAWLTTKTPKSWKYRKKNDRYHRIGDILLTCSPPRYFYFGGRKSLGAHGFDNRLPEMQATFYAWGPAFKEHYKIRSFNNIDVYPLLAQLLGLKADQPVDGNAKKLGKILK